MSLSFTQDIAKEKVFQEIEKYLANKNFNIDKKDSTRPWGGFFVINESQAESFINEYFSHLKKKIC